MNCGVFLIVSGLVFVGHWAGFVKQIWQPCSSMTAFISMTNQSISEKQKKL